MYSPYQMLDGQATANAALQVVERLAKASEKRDLLVLNFGLHFSETYKEELEQLVQQVAQPIRACSGCCGLHTGWACAVSTVRPHHRATL